MKKENLIQNLLDFKNYIKKYNENVKEILEFAELYEKQNGTPLSEEQTEYLTKVIEKLKEN